VRFSSDCWLKTSVEFEPSGPSQLGVVVTNDGYSDWSLQDFPHDAASSYRLRIRREGRDFLVEHADPETGPWRLLRMAHLNAEPEAVALAGFYACSPKGSGHRAGASLLRIDLL
jgi:regulation of enolase protein 1 (concanavalin A-like superfamily)